MRVDNEDDKGVFSSALSGLGSAASGWYEELRPTTVPVQTSKYKDDDVAESPESPESLESLESLESPRGSIEDLRPLVSQSYEDDGRRLNILDPSTSIITPRRSTLASGFLPGFSAKGSSRWVCEDGVRRSGNRWTASGHIITAVVGSGVLALPYAQAGMGWILGPIAFLLFAWITQFTAQLLVDLYIIDGRRMRTFPDMIRYVMGTPGMVVLGVLQQTNLVLTALAYTITASQAMSGIAKLAAGTDAGDAWYLKNWPMGVIFGGVQIFFSQLPNLESFWWASCVGAIMSFGYSTIALGFGIAYHGTEGGIEPMQEESTAATVWNTLNSIGTVLFAYSFAMILLEIEDTLADAKTKDGKRAGTGPVSSMKWSVNLSVATMTAYYCAISWSVFASLGYNQTGYVLDDYQGIAPNWILYVAQGMVIVHLVPAYQVWSQPHFVMVEEWLDRAIFKERVPYWVVRVGYRVFYVCVVTFLAVLLPFFNAVLGFVGAIGFWPMTVYFPVWCWRRVYKPKPAFNALLWAVDVFSLVVTLAVIAASVESMLQAAKKTELWS